MSGMGRMMQHMTKMRQALKAITVTGRAPRTGTILVQISLGKRDDLASYVIDLKVDPSLYVPEQREQLLDNLKDAFNDALKKEMDEISKSMPADAISQLEKNMAAKE